MVGRYTHAHQFKRARRELKFLRTRLDRIIRRKVERNTALEDRFGPLLDLALRVRHQEQRQRGPKVYSPHALEVKCIGKGKAIRLVQSSPISKKLTGAAVRRIHGGKGYRGHNYPNRFKVWISSQVRPVTEATVEP
jgi:transposase, IS5 family